MLNEMELKSIIKSGKLECVSTMREIKEILNISDQEFKFMWQYSYSNKDSAPEGTTDFDWGLAYQTDDEEFPVGEGKLLINISDNEINNDIDKKDWKINTIQIVFE